jgi:hypothetical protein
MTITDIYADDALSLGLIDNGQTFVRMVEGYIASATTAETLIGDYSITEMTTAGSLTISSTSADDDETGTGARTVTVYGLDANWNKVSDTVTLNGQTAVALPTVVLHPYLMMINTAGTGGTNAGVLYVGSGTVTSGQPAVVNCAIGTAYGANQSRIAFMPVPAGYKATVRGGYASSSGLVDIVLYAKYKPFGGVYLSKAPVIFGSKSNNIPFDILTPCLPEKTLIKIVGKTFSSTSNISTTVNVAFYKYK